MQRLSIIILALLFLPNFASAAATQVITGGITVTTAAAQTFVFDGLAATASNTAFPNNVATYAGSMRHWRVHFTFAPGVGNSRTLTLRDKGTNTTVTCQIQDTATDCTDFQHSFSYAVGDKIDVSETVVGTPAITGITWALDSTANNAGDMMIMGMTNTTSASAEQFTAFRAGVAGPTLTETNMIQNFPEAGTVDLLIASTSGASGGGTSYDFSLRQNFASTTLTTNVANPAVGNQDTTHTVTVAVGDTFDLATNPNATPLAVRAAYSVRYRPLIYGDFPLMGSTQASNDVAGATRYIATNGSMIPSATEASTTSVTNDMTVTSMTVKRASAPGANHTLTATLRDNSTDTSLICTLSGASATLNTCTGFVVLKGGDLVDTSLVLDTGGTVSHETVSYVGYTGIRGGAITAQGGAWIIKGGKILIK